MTVNPRRARLRLAIHLSSVSRIELPPLGMADDHVSRARRLSASTAAPRPCARLLRFGRAILTGDADVRAFEPVGHGLERRKDRRDHDLAVVCVRDQRLQRERGINRLGERLVHLPVSGDYRFFCTGFTVFGHLSGFQRFIRSTSYLSFARRRAVRRRREIRASRRRPLRCA
jgi:hypothetical protein